jgi:hypothetical protein
MRIEKNMMVALGYGKYFRSDKIVGIEPIEEEDGRGPGKRTYIFVEGLDNPVIASRSDSAILRDLVEMPAEVTRAREQQQLLTDILDSIQNVNPLMRTIIREQGQWDLDRLERRVKDVIAE